VRAVSRELDVAADVEITVECNPETADAELFGALVDAGVDRLSMGAQSFDPVVLGVLDRLHRPDRTAEAVRLARAAGIGRIGLDLIYGTPGEDDASWRGSLEAVLDVGVDRVSMGAQSFDPVVLEVLEREHRPERSAQAVALVREAGIARVSLDLIYGTPGESEASWRDTLTSVIATGVEHVSAYALSVHANTPLGRAVAAGRVPPPNDDVQRERFDELRHVLRGAGFVHYEVANLARSDALRSRHNVLYWRHGDYLGVGVGAHAHLDGRRWWTTRSTSRYLEALEAAVGDAASRDELGRVRSVTEEELLTTEERALERLMLGLRLAEGLHPFDVPPLAVEALDDVVRAELVTMACGRLQATEPGWFLIDETVRRLS